MNLVLYRFHQHLPLDKAVPIVIRYKTIQDFVAAIVYNLKHRPSYGLFSDDKVLNVGRFSDEEAMYLFNKIQLGEFDKMVPEIAKSAVELHSH